MFVDVVRAGIFGVAVGDALGVPVEFSSRSERDVDPVVDMREYGSHHQPKGTWSDDSSMMFAGMDSLIQKGEFDGRDIMKRFVAWLRKGEYTPHGKVFDVGITCSSAIAEFEDGVDPLCCGPIGERSNGNGSLMRIMPFSLLVAWDEDYWDREKMRRTEGMIHNASRLTHGHDRSLIACLLYTSVCHELIYHADEGKVECLQRAVDKTFAFYEENVKTVPFYSAHMQVELSKNQFGRVRNISEFKTLPRGEIRGSGYVLDSLESSFWCLLNTESYRDCVLAAVNLGDDTDTTAAIAGGLAGLCYGYDNIPKDWVDVLARKEWIDGLCVDFAEKFGNE